jgi:hypothetical protein
MFCVIQYPYNEVDFDDLTVMICGLHDVRFAIVIILSTSTGQALVNPKFRFAMWIGNNIWFKKIIILTLSKIWPTTMSTYWELHFRFRLKQSHSLQDANVNGILADFERESGWNTKTLRSLPINISLIKSCSITECPYWCYYISRLYHS